MRCTMRTLLRANPDCRSAVTAVCRCYVRALSAGAPERQTERLAVLATAIKLLLIQFVDETNIAALTHSEKAAVLRLLRFVAPSSRYASSAHIFEMRNQLAVPAGRYSDAYRTAESLRWNLPPSLFGDAC